MVTYEAVHPFDALGDPTRRAVFERVVARPSSVGELAAGLPVSRPAVSQHLRVLRQAGLVSDQAVGTRRVYRAEPDGVAALRRELDRMWDQALDAFKTLVESSAPDDSPHRRKSTGNQRGRQDRGDNR